MKVWMRNSEFAWGFLASGSCVKIYVGDDDYGIMDWNSPYYEVQQSFFDKFTGDTLEKKICRAVHKCEKWRLQREKTEELNRIPNGLTVEKCLER
jgi:hypothetical protein